MTCPFALRSSQNDLESAQRVFARKWRHCPWVVIVPRDEEVESEEEDDIWGFDIDAQDDEDDLWGSSIGDEKEDEGVYWVKAYPLDDPTCDQLGKLRIWNEKDRLFIIPKTLIDEQDIVIQIGDLLVFGSENYKIEEVLRWGQWRDSQEFLLLIFNCTLLNNGRC